MAQNVEFLGALVVIVFLLPIFKMEYATDTYYMENHGFRHTYAPHSVCLANEREVCNNAFPHQKKNPSPKKLGEMERGCVARGNELCRALC